MPHLRQRLLQATWKSRSLSRKLSQRGSAAIQRRGPLHRLLRHLYRLSRRHPVSVNQWDAQYAAGDYGERLDSISEVTHNMVILGYLAYGAKEPMVLDVGCGHGRLLQFLAGFGFAEYVGVDWSGQAVQRARSLSIPHTRFEVADMDHWDTTERFDAVVLNECLYYSAVEPREMFERAIGWLAEDGVVIVSMFRGLGARYIWSRVQSGAVEQLAACAVKDCMTGKVWDVKALRPRPANLAIGSDWRRPASSLRGKAGGG
jgi:SAM-dependent methyltransferase